MGAIKRSLLMSIRSDLERKLQKVLAEDPRTQELSVEIIDESGYITLEGSVPSEEDRKTAAKVVGQQDGVIEVANNIEVSTGDQEGDVTPLILPPRNTSA
jgi:osmotically-inducible protein OsmY